MSTGTLFGSMLGLQYLRKCLKLSKRSISTCELTVWEHYISFSCLIKKTTSSNDCVIFSCPLSAKFCHTNVHVCAHIPAREGTYSPSAAESVFTSCLRLPSSLQRLFSLTNLRILSRVFFNFPPSYSISLILQQSLFHSPLMEGTIDKVKTVSFRKLYV